MIVEYECSFHHHQNLHYMVYILIDLYGKCYRVRFLHDVTSYSYGGGLVDGLGGHSHHLRAHAQRSYHMLDIF